MIDFRRELFGTPALWSRNYDDSDFTFSCSDPWPAGEGNRCEDPCFIDPESENWRLDALSPCINAGDNSLAVGETDLAGNPRISNGTVDMGAYENLIEGFVISGRVRGRGLLYPLMAVVQAGESVPFQAEEIHGPFSHFEKDGVFVSDLPTYTWENIQADGVITAVFESKTWYVDDDQNGDGSSWEAALQSIQAAVDEAVDGDTILVNDGTYNPIWTENKAITIRSVNGVQKTLIDGAGIERCATLGDDSSDHQTILDGFTLQNGFAEEGGGAYGGTLTNCTLTGNQAESDGGGAYGGMLTNCTLTGNQAESDGGGACESTLTNCTLKDNQAEFLGGGACDCILSNCTLTGNFSYDGAGGAYNSTLYNCLLEGNSSASCGGGAEFSFLTNCLLIDNFARFGGGAFDSTLRNCTISSNAAWEQGGGVCDCALANCIIWGNTAPEGENYYIEDEDDEDDDQPWDDDDDEPWDDDDDGDDDYDPMPGDDAGLVYCCTTPLPDGQGNIDATPLFVDPANGDYRLRTGSPCTDAGNTALVTGDDETDLAGNPRIGNGTVDMGAYEGVAPGFVISGKTEGYGEISPRNAVVSAGETVTFEVTESGRAFSHFLVNGKRVTDSARTYTFTDIQADAVITAVFAHKTWYVDAAKENDEGDGSSWNTAKSSIQAAVDEAVDGDIIEVAQGEYLPIVTDNKAITIQSVEGPELTIISGGEYQRCATLCNGFSQPKTVLIGFTLQHGIMEIIVQEFKNGIFRETYYWGDGGGAHGGTLINCRLLNNRASYGGGAAYCTLIDCTLAGNYASQGFGAFDEAGGGAYMCSLNNCELRENSADRSGGGAYDCLLTNCTLYGNGTNSSGGGAASSTLSNCTLVNNWAGQSGGGVYACELYNSVVWGNSAPVDANYAASSFMYSCTEPFPVDGEGNICEDPLFVDVESGNFRLSAESPCIDAGSNASAAGDFDLAGNPRILYGVVDMGAYEFTSMSALPDGKYDWQSGWNTLYLPFNSLAPDTTEALAEMPVFRPSANTFVMDKPVSLHTPLWVFCVEPESAPVLQGTLTSGMPADPLDIPVGKWMLVGAQCRIAELPPEYVAWEWRAGRYTCVQSLQPGHVYFIYRSKTP